MFQRDLSVEQLSGDIWRLWHANVLLGSNNDNDRGNLESTYITTQRAEQYKLAKVIFIAK